MMPRRHARAADVQTGTGVSPWRRTNVEQPFLLAVALATVETMWTFTSGNVPAREAAWITVTSLVLGLVAFVTQRLLAMVSRSRAVNCAWFLALPILVFGARSPANTSTALESGVGPLRVATTLGLLVLVSLMSRRNETRPVTFWLFCLVSVHLAAFAFAIRALDVDRVQILARCEPSRTMLLILLAAVSVGLAAVATRWLPARVSILPSAIGTYLLVGAVAIGCTRVAIPHLPAARSGNGAGGPSVILIVMDTVRSDALSCYGNPRPTTPHLDRFASEATLFRRAYSNGTYSLPGHGSMFTGLLPSEHGGHNEATLQPGLINDSERPLSSDQPTLATTLREAGLPTVGLAANNLYLTHWFGLTRGFETMRADGPYWLTFFPNSVPLRFRLGARRTLPPLHWFWDAETITAATLEWISRTSTPFFLFVNYMDAHQIDADGHYPVRPEYRDRVRGAPAAKRDYEANVAYLDEHVGSLFRHIKESNLWGDSLIIVTADHGELFGEHGWQGHRFVAIPYEGVVRIPLIVKFPGQTAGRVETRLVSLKDLFALVQAVRRGEAWYPPPDNAPTVIAESWSPPPHAPSLPPRGVPYCRAIYDGRHKLIEHWDGADELFDLDADPGEDNNLVVADRRLAEGVRATIAKSVPPLRNLRPRPGAKPPEIPQDLIERMKALGYAQ
jgi:arylsulfatase A-like enzyme